MHQILTLDGKLRAKTAPPDLTPEELIFLYRCMLRVRAIDEKLMTLQRQGRVGFYGACTGQEAAAVGSGYALNDDDWIFPGLREGGVALMRGMSLRKYVAQVMGNSADLLKGRQMPCHYSDRSIHYVSWSSCIGTQIPHAVGTAWAMKAQGKKTISMAYFGDGATSEGDFHVAMNFAGVFSLPVVFFCQNNQWAISVPVELQTASESIAVKAEAYGFEGLQVDGNDVLAVYQTTKEAAEKARQGKGPTLIEALTYRMGAHSSSDDPSRYRDESITEKWKRKDPIFRLERYLLSQQIVDDGKIEDYRKEFNQEIGSVVEEMETCPPPAPETLFEDVYSVPPWRLVEEQNAFFGEPYG